MEITCTQEPHHTVNLADNNSIYLCIPQLLAWHEVDHPQSLKECRHRDKEKMSWVQQVEFQMIFFFSNFL